MQQDDLYASFTPKFSLLGWQTILSRPKRFVTGCLYDSVLVQKSMWMIMMGNITQKRTMILQCVDLIVCAYILTMRSTELGIIRE